MDVEIVIAELMRVLKIKHISPTQYQEVLQLLLELEIPKEVKSAGFRP